MKIGYARVSTGTQNLQLQIDALKAAGCTRIFEEVQSGANPSRKQMELCLLSLRAGDELVVWSIDRLSRTKKESDQILHFLKDHNIDLISLKEGINTKDMVGKLVINILIAVAESERERGIERTKAGLEAARQRGKTGGRPFKHDLKTRRAIKMAYMSKEYSLNEIGEMYNVTKNTIYKYIRGTN